MRQGAPKLAAMVYLAVDKLGCQCFYSVPLAGGYMVIYGHWTLHIKHCFTYKIQESHRRCSLDQGEDNHGLDI